MNLSKKNNISPTLRQAKIIVACTLFIFQYSGFIHKTFAQNSVLANADFYKIAITETGVYKIDANFLKKAGIDISKINPQNIKLFGNGGSMLPQANKTTRPNDLTENAILVQGEADGKFDDQDYILFYGEGPHTILVDTATKKIAHQINIYSDSSFYFLTITDTYGLRLKTQNDASTQGNLVDSFDDFQFHDSEQKNMNGSGRTWYGEYFGSTSELSFDNKIDGIVSGTPVIINSAAMSIAQVNSSMQVKANGQLIGTHSFYSVYVGEFAIKGDDDSKSFNWNNDGSGSLKLTYTYDGKGQSSSGAYLNYFEIQLKRKIQFYDKQTILRSFESLKNANTKFQIQQVQADSKVWEITKPQNPAIQNLTINGNGANFVSNTNNTFNTFVLFNNSNLLTPQTIRKIQNQNLHAASVPDLLIVSPNAYKTQAQKLADFRQKNDSLNVLVVSVEEIYNEFSSGKLDPTAIRDFGRFLWKQNSQKLKYLLLFGDATFDYKNYINLQGINPNNFVPVYESQESLNPIFTYSSDDYFGFFQEKDGDWAESFAGDQLLDIGIGRLPIKSTDEAEGVVEKLINYANPQKTLGRWRGQVSFIADDGDGNLHEQDAEDLSNLAFVENKDLNINKIYVDAYQQITTPNGAKAPSVNAAIEQAINNGSLVINYNGHGGEIGWAEEQILTIGEIQDFRNLNNLPLFLTATCQFGRYDNPTIVSGAELAMLNRRGAAIGLLTTTRPVYENTNFLLNQSFYNALFDAKNKELPKLGDLIRITKNNSLSGVNNRNFALLGDPSMKLNYPKQKIQITKINNKAVGVDTLKALSKVTIEGQIQNKFNGIVFVTIFDKPSIAKTLGQKGADGPKMNYTIYKNKLFEGKASVSNGKFQVTFTMPKDIVYTYGNGRIQCYAMSADSSSDAIGSTNDIIVGGSGSTIPDSKAPNAQLFMNDTNFKDGEEVGQSPVLIANISDDSGINLSQAGIGHEMLLTLNDTLQILVSDYYTANINDYTKGMLVYPFKNLPIGNYTVKLKIWDIYNNSEEVALKFKVVEENFKIIKVKYFPNPFESQANFEIQHNRAGDDLIVKLEIIDAFGKTFRQIEKNYYHCDSILDNLLLEGENLNKGIYYYRIRLSSLTQSTETQATGKLYYLK